MRAVNILVFLTVLSIVWAVAATPFPRPVLPSTSIPVFLSSGMLLTNTHEVVGRLTGASPIDVQLSGTARFSNASSYFCVASGADETQTLGPQVIPVDGSHFRILHASADKATVTYRCIGM
jgi:hypothetical protein